MDSIAQIQAIFPDVNTVKERLNSLRKTLAPGPPSEILRGIESALFMNESLRVSLMQLDRKFRDAKRAGKL